MITSPITVTQASPTLSNSSEQLRKEGGKKRPKPTLWSGLVPIILFQFGIQIEKLNLVKSNALRWFSRRNARGALTNIESPLIDTLAWVGVQHLHHDWYSHQCL